MPWREKEKREESEIEREKTTQVPTVKSGRVEGVYTVKNKVGGKGDRGDGKHSVSISGATQRSTGPQESGGGERRTEVDEGCGDVVLVIVVCVFSFFST